MCGRKLEITIGGQPVGVTFDEEHIEVAVTRETIQVPVDGGGIRFSIKEERLDFSSPLVLAAPGWPFGPNPNRVDGLARDAATVVDEVVMPAFYRVAKWLFLITDEANDLAVTSEIKCMRRGGDVYFMEYAVMGDAGLITYDLDAVAEGEKIKLIVTSKYDGALTVRTSKLGIFNS